MNRLFSVIPLSSASTRYINVFHPKQLIWMRDWFQQTQL